MIRILTIIGARPQIIKAAALSRAVQKHNAACAAEDRVEEVLLHTGQHYDENMSAVFFRELGIPEPDINLQVGSGTHGVQTARMIEGIEKVLLEQPFDGMVLYGDTNSTLAGAVAAAKLGVPVFHIEAGLRSWNRSMPEEVNRIVCDELSNVLFAPTQTAVDNLAAAGYTDSKAHFAAGKRQKVVKSGDVMYDNSMYFSRMADAKSDIIERMGLQPRNFVLATIHRPANTDNEANLRSILRALADIAEEERLPVVLPLHPRTRARMAQLQNLPVSEWLKITDPASFFEIIRLEKHARAVMTDSGGVQKEAFFFGTPCVILRPETEWTEIVEAGAGILADADYGRIVKAYRELSGRTVVFPPLFGDAHAAEHMLEEITDYVRGR